MRTDAGSGSNGRQDAGPVLRGAYRNADLMEEKFSVKVTFNCRPAEFSRIHQGFSHSAAPTLSFYIRQVLLRGPVVVRYRNASLDDCMEELIQLRQELVQVTQSLELGVERLYPLRLIPEFREWIRGYQDDLKKYDSCLESIYRHIAQMSEQWSQE
ncbi:MAG TPA: hypothetical protein VG870_02335 [Chitinophagaceae bacterium]|nr:hypothetical protein [Chitinophagaceae bacterium]